MKNVLLWGNGFYFDIIRELILDYEVSGDIKILGMVDRVTSSSAVRGGKIPLIAPDKIKDAEYDLIIITADFAKESIRKNTIELFIEQDKVVDIEYFFWKNYVYERNSFKSLSSIVKSNVLKHIFDYWEQKDEAEAKKVKCIMENNKETCKPYNDEISYIN